MRYVPGFYDQVVVREFLGRFGETVHRPQPIYFYIRICFISLRLGASFFSFLPG